jgi:hypothetical protein
MKTKRKSRTRQSSGSRRNTSERREHSSRVVLEQLVFPFYQKTIPNMRDGRGRVRFEYEEV